MSGRRRHELLFGRLRPSHNAMHRMNNGLEKCFPILHHDEMKTADIYLVMYKTSISHKDLYIKRIRSITDTKENRLKNHFNCLKILPCRAAYLLLPAASTVGSSSLIFSISRGSILAISAATAPPPRPPDCDRSSPRSA